MRTNYYFFCLIIATFFTSSTSFAQSGNFDQTWKEFLENNKISNMSALIKPDKRYDQPAYAQYLLMNINSDFCQSDVEDAEELMEELKGMDIEMQRAIEGFMPKADDLETKLEAYHIIDGIWKRFLLTKEVDLDELEAVKATKSICEKKTLAKYSYMTAYHHFCEGDVAKSKDIFENRTLRLTEKTSLRVRDVEGLGEEVAKMKSLYQDMAKLESTWNRYIQTGVSPGFDIDLPLFPCNPIPNMKAFVLKGAIDLCNAGPGMLEEIKKLEKESGISPNGELANKVEKLEADLEQNNANLADLNKAWETFIPNNETSDIGVYGYEYCEIEPLIRAYIIDGFSYVCLSAEDALQKIDDLQRRDRRPLEQITMIKINELAALSGQYRAEGKELEGIWNKFIAQGDILYEEDYESAEYYCDNIHQVKFWAMKGLSSSCEEGHLYLEQIENFQRDFEFNFTKELECRVQKLRGKVWTCRHDALLKLAKIEAPEAYEARLEELKVEYRLTERPEVCSGNE